MNSWSYDVVVIRVHSALIQFPFCNSWQTVLFFLRTGLNRCGARYLGASPSSQLWCQKCALSPVPIVNVVEEVICVIAGDFHSHPRLGVVTPFLTSSVNKTYIYLLLPPLQFGAAWLQTALVAYPLAMDDTWTIDWSDACLAKLLHTSLIAWLLACRHSWSHVVRSEWSHGCRRRLGCLAIHQHLMVFTKNEIKSNFKI